MKIAIASGKGGTGKTTVSVNLTEKLTQKAVKTILADLDVEEPNSALFQNIHTLESKVQYKLVPTWNKSNCIQCGHCQKICQFNAIVCLPGEVLVFDKMCHSCFACSDLCPTKALPMKHVRIGETNSEQNFIEGRLDLGQEMSTQLISKTKSQAYESNLQIFIFDAPPGTSCPMIEAVNDVDYVILVTEPTIFGLNDLKLAVETIQMMNLKFGIVINKSNKNDTLIEKYCADNQFEILTKVPHMKSAAKKYSSGEKMLEIQEIDQAFEKLAVRLLEEK